MLVLVLVLALPAVAQPPEIRRLAGPTRIETAIAISADTYGAGRAGAVVLARSDAFPDALAGGPLAASVDGPLLLTPSTTLAPVTLEEIRRVLPAGGTVLVLGGESAISAAVESAVADAGYATRRLAGSNRIETALAIARAAAPRPGFITVATGNDFPDALIGGALATTFADGVLLLTDADRLPATVDAYLDEHATADVVTVGPAAAAAVPEAFTVSGDTPSLRSVAAAETFYGGIDPSGVSVASVEDYPDGLAGAPHAFDAGSLPLLLTPSEQLPQRHVDYLSSLDARGRSYVYGGARAVEDAVVEQMRAALTR